MGVTKYDFSGWATKNDLRCSDGRTIRRDAFKHNDGATVPLVWQHLHNDPTNVLGHCLLENREEGVYAYGVFNNTEAGKQAKSLVEHGDVDQLSIYANGLDQKGGDVYHGDIKEVSLVLAGANPGARIDYPILEHSGEEFYDEAVIYTGEDLSLHHADDTDEEDEKDKKNDEDEEKEDAKDENPESSEEDKKPEEDDEDKKKSDEDDEDKDKDKSLQHSDTNPTIQEVFNTLTDVQKNAVYAIIAEALDDDDEVEHSEGGDDEMKHNVFDNDTKNTRTVLSHDDFKTIFADAKRLGSLKDAVAQHMEEGGVLAHAVYNHDADGERTTEQTYGIADIDYLFPEARSLNNPPEFVSRDMDWVYEVMRGVRHTPFSRVKSQFANITMDEARARGYVKGNLKVEEVFGLLKRNTDPQTIYKKQKLDRDDIIDITDFDVVAWLKREMRMMLDEEIARAVLVGDGRTTADDDKISEDHVRSVLNDHEFFTLTVAIQAGADEAKTAKNVIKGAVRARKNYKGSGNPIMFVSEDWLTEMLLLEDEMARPLYDTQDKLATALRVRKIVSCPVFEGLQKDGHDIVGIILNLADYNVGADKGGEVSMFDDFDIDYNQMKYLIETRISGALVKPFSSIVLQIGGESSSTAIPETLIPKKSGTSSSTGGNTGGNTGGTTGGT